LHQLADEHRRLVRGDPARDADQDFAIGERHESIVVEGMRRLKMGNRTMTAERATSHFAARDN
jgi:hypothetical protein